MESLIFLGAILFIGYIIYWSLRNDKAKSISDQTGLIRMRGAEEPARGPARDKPRSA